jgi:hypothetical protein
LRHIPLDFFEKNIAAINGCGDRAIAILGSTARYKPSTR